MRSRLGTQCMPFFSAHSAEFIFSRQQMLYFNVLRQLAFYIIARARDSHIYSLWHSQALSGLLSGSLWLSLARCPALSGSLSGSLWPSLTLWLSLWLPLALSGSLCLYIALRICLQSPCLAHKALARLGTLFLSSNTLISPGIMYHAWLIKVL